MFNDRFGELARKPDAPVLERGSWRRIADADGRHLLAERARAGRRHRRRTAAIVTEAKRVRQFGFTPAELDRAKRSMVSFYERAYNERNETESGSFAGEYISWFLNGEPSPGIDYEYRLVQQVLPGITLEEVSGLVRAAAGCRREPRDSGDRARESLA